VAADRFHRTSNAKDDISIQSEVKRRDQDLHDAGVREFGSSWTFCNVDVTISRSLHCRALSGRREVSLVRYLSTGRASCGSCGFQSRCSSSQPEMTVAETGRTLGARIDMCRPLLLVRPGVNSNGRPAGYGRATMIDGRSRRTARLNSAGASPSGGGDSCRSSRGRGVVAIGARIESTNCDRMDVTRPD